MFKIQTSDYLDWLANGGNHSHPDFGGPGCYTFRSSRQWVRQNNIYRLSQNEVANLILWPKWSKLAKSHPNWPKLAKITIVKITDPKMLCTNIDLKILLNQLAWDTLYIHIILLSKRHFSTQVAETMGALALTLSLTVWALKNSGNTSSGEKHLQASSQQNVVAKVPSGWRQAGLVICPFFVLQLFVKRPNWEVHSSCF